MPLYYRNYSENRRRKMTLIDISDDLNYRNILNDDIRKMYGSPFKFYDDSRYCDFDCGGCRAICLHNDDRLIRRLDGVGWNLSFDEEWTPFEIPDLPKYVWTVDRSVRDREGFYSVPLSKIMSPKTLNFSREKSLRKRLHIPEDSPIIFSSNEQDEWLDMWSEEPYQIAQGIKDYDFDYAFPMYYSCYFNYPRIDFLLNMKYRMISLKTFQDEGIKVIPQPDASMYEPDTTIDSNRWVEWYSENKCNYAVVGVGDYSRRKEDFLKQVRWLYNLAEEVRNNVGIDIHFFIYGGGLMRMSWLRESFPYPFTCIDRKCCTSSAARMVIGKGQGVGGKRYGLSQIDCFDLNRVVMEARRDGVILDVMEEIAKKQGRTDGIPEHKYDLSKPLCET